ncbi:MAG: aminoglycoside phosphotransferase family protein [Alphaproteobacteria bacterium]
MSERGDAIAHFLAASGWGEASRAPLAGDASFRRYDRLSRGKECAVLMDAPPPQENVRPWLAIARHLSGLGYSAPRVLAADEAAGLVLLEDLGDGLYTRLLATVHDESLEAVLYAAAIDLLVDLHRRPPPQGIDRYDEPKRLANAELFLDWYLPRRFGSHADERERAAFRTAWREVLPLAGRVPEALALRDYHADNLIWLPGRAADPGDPNGLRRVGLLDFQDASLAPLTYDIVSLLEDARRDVPPALAERMIRRYLAASPNLDEATFRAAYAVTGAQRNVRILGVFSRLAVRDGKARYLDYLPRVWGLVERDLAHPALAPVAAWFARAVPPAMRERAA